MAPRGGSGQDRRQDFLKAVEKQKLDTVRSVTPRHNIPFCRQARPCAQNACAARHAAAGAAAAACALMCPAACDEHAAVQCHTTPHAPPSAFTPAAARSSACAFIFHHRWSLQYGGQVGNSRAAAAHTVSPLLAPYALRRPHCVGRRIRLAGVGLRNSLGRAIGSGYIEVP